MSEHRLEPAASSWGPLPYRHVSLYGYGRLGQALATRLSDQGVCVHAFDRRADEAIPVLVAPPPNRCTNVPRLGLMTLPHGDDSRDALEHIDPVSTPTLVDLTTQPPSSARRNGFAWRARGGAYYAGGSNGGALAIRTGRSSIVVGPTPTPAVLSILRLIGRVLTQNTAEHAALLKLCHNAYLVIENEMASTLAQLCHDRNVALEDLATVIEEGPAGRRFRDLTAIRHLRGGYTTSYTGRYAAKDWKHFCELLTEAERDAFAFLDRSVMMRRLAARADGPWV